MNNKKKREPLRPGETRMIVDPLGKWVMVEGLDYYKEWLEER